MERLTKRNEYGSAYVIGIGSHKLLSSFNFDEMFRFINVAERLAEYEELGITPGAST
jgi:hypothetical protein